MPVLRFDLQRPRGRRMVIRQPGLYPLTPHLASTKRESHWPRGVWLALLVCHLGDFVARRASGSETQTRQVVRVSGRPLLGDLERLSGEVQVDLSVPGSADPSSSCSVEYSQLEGPPVRFQMPAGSSLQCRYSTRPLAGRTVIRCNGCYQLFSNEAWTVELVGRCPACGWSPRELNGGAPREVSCEAPF
jgi:hypothetical protein